MCLCGFGKSGTQGVEHSSVLMAGSLFFFLGGGGAFVCNVDAMGSVFNGCMLCMMGLESLS